ncbi:serine/threonine-protein kinase [Streptomyces sp. MK37H]|uniref:serine/threonine-protein kinase n=1 Tax=Streptomyces sp. MK37H TaxID=2699117 RepID=UPI001B388997|nr:serine/threonine-protein kinase [Streptomyces sp. MK37H]MBP8533269.1 protein kinase [Streptomyces sp. MK37H]
MERGERIAGRYELVRWLGRGGMGEVWAGRDHRPHRDVALKLLVLDDGLAPDLPAWFEREAVAAAQISHPNVVALYDRGMHENVLFLVMEKVEGPPLSRIIHQESRLGPGRVLRIADGICSALAAAHHAGIVHYDIKPHNVMLTSDGQVKVVDFGIAGFLQTAFSLVRSSQLAPAGTPEYAAPEQFGAERGDRRSDLYALGGVLFVLLTGRPPYTGHSALALMAQKIEEDAPPARRDTSRPAHRADRPGRAAPGTRSWTAPRLRGRGPAAAAAGACGPRLRGGRRQRPWQRPWEHRGSQRSALGTAADAGSCHGAGLPHRRP